jgi:HAD superfamily hydrolase (TIGR01509 family)
MTRKFDAVIFDMDGTLIEQMLDFQVIRAELGISPRNGILEAIEQMPTNERARAMEYLLNHELAAARQTALIPGAIEIITRIRASGLKTALLTRNSRPAMELILERFFPDNQPFELTWSREDGPIKPAPDGVLRACSQLGVEPARTCCVGDFHYDVTAANAAGATSVLLIHAQPPSFANEADHVITHLSELAEVLGI